MPLVPYYAKKPGIWQEGKWTKMENFVHLFSLGGDFVAKSAPKPGFEALYTHYISLRQSLFFMKYSTPE